jgi:two-component system LytT family response regulator
MIRALLIDDEPKATENLSHLIQEYCPELEIVGKASSLTDAVHKIEETEPDLVFLDIQLGAESGFDLFDKIPQPDFEIIVVTAYDDYALKAFNVAAIDYLLKPIDIERLIDSVKRVSKKITAPDQAQIETLLQSLKSPHGPEQIILPSLESLMFVKTKDIVRCESLDNYTNFYLTSGKVVLVSKNIKFYEDLLEDSGFYRVHRSHLINIAFIKEYHKGEGGYILLEDGTDIPVSRRKKTSFLNYIQQKA